MHNLIKMDLYRMLKSMSTWVIIICIIGSVISEALMYPRLRESVSVFEETVEFLRSGNIILIVSIFTTLFVSAEHKNGFIKNIAGRLINRGIIIISRVAALSVIIVVFCLIAVLSSIIHGNIIFGIKFELAQIPAFMKIFGTQILLNIAFAIVIMTLYMITKSTAFTMVIGVFITSGLFHILYGGISNLFIKIFKLEQDFTIQKYIISGNVFYLSSDTTDFKTPIIVACTFIVIFTAVSFFIMKKRDIK